MKTLGCLCLLLLLTACPGMSSESSQQPAPPPTLLLRNFSTSPFSIHLGTDRIGTAMPGVASCFILRSLPPGRHELILRAHATRVSIYAPAEDLTSSAGWSIELGQSPSIEVHSLQPAEPCKP